MHPASRTSQVNRVRRVHHALGLFVVAQRRHGGMLTPPFSLLHHDAIIRVPASCIRRAIGFFEKSSTKVCAQVL